MSKQVQINNAEELAKLKLSILETAESTTTKLKELLEHKKGIDLFHEIRFHEFGQDPLEDRALNLVEQLNQTFTYLTSLMATEYLLETHPEHAPFILNLGTSPGYDVVSKDEVVIAETFSAVSPSSNDKLKKDCIRVRAQTGALHKYVFYYSPDKRNVDNVRSKYPNVKIVLLDLWF
ncbi:hypothetical protein [Desulfosporosinus sp. BICA1-9]|uniref:hypothetical protein n=1 Tax=Desulfosporosinus sp. BICA1-9 TaxID=1531958 RepID=UPI00054C03C2|nr:hypothetical protein [Desulfosporosinus sp. BICA1-9]KJS47979.1 MAG: hypothetical protein VR66_16590 [Peptococcaceae bacterium BRH_c23]KJS85189.1 MAG: hypothetical protein JL57_19260 [Desulfosporosinus sp. BICA1-9]HBW38305.1 hypothetical protein [Desulfosporosinus sp.]